MSCIKFAAQITVIIFVSLNIVSAQLINGDFENWDELGNPSNWNTGEVPGSTNPITQSTDSQNGTYSVKLEVVDYLGVPYSGNLQSIDSVNIYGHPINQKYAAVNGYYKFTQTGSSHLLMVVGVHDSSFMLIGVGGFDKSQSVNNWTPFTIPIDYYDDGDAASIVISISITDTSSTGIDPTTIGSTALIDNLTLGNPTKIEKNKNIITEYSLSQNYPNPFNPSTKIKYSLPAGKQEFPNVQLIVYDILGRKVKTLVNEVQKAGHYEIEFNASELSNGIYFYKLTSNDFTETKKMILIK